MLVLDLSNNPLTNKSLRSGNVMHIDHTFNITVTDKVSVYSGLESIIMSKITLSTRFLQIKIFVHNCATDFLFPARAFCKMRYF